MIVMLWLCIACPRLPFEALSLKEDELLAVTLVDGRTRRILTASKAAEKLGFSSGTHFITASTLCATLKSIDRNPQAERKALQRLAAWAYQWSSSVVVQLADPKSLTDWSCVWLEIAASFVLFGGRDALLRQIELSLKTLRYDYRLGVAHSLEAAALLARAQRRVIVETGIALRRQLKTLPLTLLPLAGNILSDLQRTGIRTIDVCIDLPRDALARRFGPNINNYFDKLLGNAPDPRPLYTLPKKYRARCELGAEVTDAQALLFPLRRMLGEFQGYLRAIDGGVQRFIVHLKHREGGIRVPIGMSAAERNAERFFSLVRERFEKLVLSQPVLEVGLQADRFTPPTAKQNEFFGGANTIGDEFQHLLDKLTARLGEGSVHSYALVADHRPENAWRIAEPGTTTKHDAPHASRPLWLFAEPREIAAPTSIDRPERVEGGWWDRSDVRRDYYFLSTDNGATAWVYRDLGTGRWFMHGLCG